MKRLTILRGAPGSGKSTLARNILKGWVERQALGEWVRCSVNEADSFMIDSEGRYAFDGNRLSECHRMCQQDVCGHMQMGYDEIIVANTSTRLWEIQPYLVLAGIWGYEVRIIHCVGQWTNTHGVSEDRVQKMRDNYEPADGECVYRA